MKTQYIILDFEMNPVAKQNKEARSRLHREIIEIGAVKLDSDHNIVDKFSCYVKPQYNAEINPFIRNLTGISTWEVCTASYFEETIAQLEEWIGYDHATTVYSWGQTDLDQLKKECAYKQVMLPGNMSDWVDFQAVYSDAMEFTDEYGQMSLHTAAEQFGISMDEKASHSALYDAEITAELFIPVLTGEYRCQADLLHNTVLKEIDKSGFTLGDSCGAILREFLMQMDTETQELAFAR